MSVGDAFLSVDTLTGTVVVKTLWKFFGDTSITHVLFGSSLQLPHHGNEQRAQLFYVSVFLEGGAHATELASKGSELRPVQSDLSRHAGAFLTCAFECVRVSVDWESAALTCKS